MVRTSTARVRPVSRWSRFWRIVCELVSTSSARGATPCWQTVVTDWSDGRIDGTYPMGCYRQALQAMPEDIRLYSSAVDDIQRALARRVRATSRTLAGGFVARRSAAPNPPSREVRGLTDRPPLLLGGARSARSPACRSDVRHPWQAALEADALTDSDDNQAPHPPRLPARPLRRYRVGDACPRCGRARFGIKDDAWLVYGRAR